MCSTVVYGRRIIPGNAESHDKCAFVTAIKAANADEGNILLESMKHLQ